MGRDLKAAGLTITAGFELEWVVPTPDASGAPRPVIPGGPYGADRLIEGFDYASALLRALDVTPFIGPGAMRVGGHAAAA